MNYVNIIILVFIAFGAVIGFKRGFTRQLVSLVGMFAIVVLAFIFKDPVSVILYNNLPFFNLGGIFKDITILNILIYEVIAFLIVFFILLLVFKILVKITNVFEKILKATIILSIPSKILGAILGIVQNYIFAFIILFILSLPIFEFKFIKESNTANTILNKTPILTNICDKTLSIFDEIIELKEKYENTNNVSEFNQEVVDKMIEKNIITKENVIKLIDKGKIKNVKV